VRILSVHGSQRAERGRVEELAVGTEVLRHVVTTVTRRPEGWLDHGQDGLLPTSLFDSLYFDNASGLVVVNPGARDLRAHTEDDADGGGLPETPRSPW
jgi:hypothetical protein